MSGCTRTFLLGVALALASAAPSAQVLVPEGLHLQPSAPDSFLARGILTEGSRQGERDLYPFSISADSQVVIADPSGDSLRLPLSIVQTLGRVADDVEGDPPTSETAWSFDDGRIEVLLRRDIHARTALLAVAFTALLLTLIIVWLVSRLRRERALRRTVESVGLRLNEGREAERLRLAQDLHDGPIQELLAAGRNLEVALIGSIESDSNHTTLVSLAAAEQRLSGAVYSLRALTESLRPPSLGPFGLPSALRDLADRLRADHPDLRVVVHADAEADVPEGLRLALFRIAQEAAVNAIKHGPPSTITFSLEHATGGPTLTIQDDGPGFVLAGLDQYGQSRHYGVLGMIERARGVGGVLMIETAPGAGTSIQVLLHGTRPERTTHVTPSRTGKTEVICCERQAEP